MKETQIALVCRLAAWKAYEAHANFCVYYRLPFNW